MTRDELALQIFLKRMPRDPFRNDNAAWFKSRVEESYVLAALFLSMKPEPTPVDITGKSVVDLIKAEE